MPHEKQYVDTECQYVITLTIALFVQQGNPALVQTVSCWLEDTPERDLDVMTTTQDHEGLNEKPSWHLAQNARTQGRMDRH